MLSKITLTSMIFDSVQATKGTGGIAHVTKLNGYMEIYSSTFTTLSATDGSLLYSDSTYGGYILQSSTLQCLSSTSFNQTSAIDTVLASSWPTTIGSAVYVTGSLKGLTASSNSYSYCYVATAGAIYSLKSTSMTDSSSTYTKNAALNGGSIKCEACSATIYGSTFTYNFA